MLDRKSTINQRDIKLKCHFIAAHDAKGRERQMQKIYMMVAGCLLAVLAGCGYGDDSPKEDSDVTSVSFVLDWTPNTNHTGIYVAKEKGYFEEAGLDVDIMLPGEAGAEQLIATGKADFGVSFQEYLTMARHEDLPIVSIAAVLQHNTAGYASAVEEGITEPKDFEGKIYGAAGNEIDKAMLKTVMEENGADFSKVEFQNTGDADFFTLIKRDIDFSLVYQGWTGMEAELRDQDLNMVYLSEFSEALDFYTPVLATSEKMIDDNPETVEAFVHATVKGYEYAIEHPEEAANILIESEPDIDPELVQLSQSWLATKYQDDAAQFGVQEKERWEVMKEFLLDNGIMDHDMDIDQAFTNEFLPEK